MSDRVFEQSMLQQIHEAKMRALRAQDGYEKMADKTTSYALALLALVEAHDAAARAYREHLDAFRAKRAAA